MRTIGWLFKFLVIPIALAAIGFFFIGPRLGSDVGKRISEGHEELTKTLEKLTPVEGSPSKSKPPKVELNEEVVQPKR